MSGLLLTSTRLKSIEAVDSGVVAVSSSDQYLLCFTETGHL